MRQNWTVTEMFRMQDLRDEIDRLTSSHAAALEKERLLQKEKKREIQRLYAHTDELNLRIKVLYLTIYYAQNVCFNLSIEWKTYNFVSVSGLLRTYFAFSFVAAE